MCNHYARPGVSTRSNGTLITRPIGGSKLATGEGLSSGRQARTLVSYAEPARSSGDPGVRASPRKPPFGLTAFSAAARAERHRPRKPRGRRRDGPLSAQLPKPQPRRKKPTHLKRRTRTCLAAGGSLLMATTGLFSAAASASADSTSPVVGYTYVDDNTATANTIAGFDRHADGSLERDPGLTIPGWGRRARLGPGVPGGDTGSEQRQVPLAVDAGSNQVSVLRITANGVPVLVGQPVPSGGVTPVSVAVSWTGLVYVANQGQGGSGYSGFRLRFDGSLTPVPGSTVTVPDGSGVGDVSFNALGNLLIGTRTGTSQVDSFVVLPSGRLLEPRALPLPGRA